MRGLLVASVVILALASTPIAAHADSGSLLLPREPPANGLPQGFRIDVRKAVAIASATSVVQSERDKQPTKALVARPTVLGDQFWSVDFFRGREWRAEVLVDGRSGKVIAAEHGRELQWPQIYHGLHGSQARHVNVAMVLLGLLFAVVFIDPRRLMRLVHLDLLALLSLGVSYGFGVHGNVYVATPLFYPPLIYLVVRFVQRALRARDDDGVVGWMSARWLAVVLGGLLVFRYGFDLLDGHVSDVGYASLFGADSIKHGYDIYDSSAGSGNLDTYGPANYLAYVPFTWIVPFDGLSRAHTGAAQAAAMTFDALTVMGLYVLGRAASVRAGLLLAVGFAAFPFTFLTLTSNTNDGLIAALLVWTLVAVRKPLVRGVLLGFASAAKFAPAILAGLFLRGRDGEDQRSKLVYAGAFVVTVVLLIALWLPDGGIREFYDATLGFQISRTSPFSMWGLHPAWDPLHYVFEAVAVGLGLAALRYPLVRNPRTLAAAGAALIIAVQLTTVHWYYFYVTWFVPYALVALVSLSYAGSVKNSGSSSASAVATNRS